MQQILASSLNKILNLAVINWLSISDEEDTATASVSNVQKAQSPPVLSNGVAASYPPPRYCDLL